jgi:hypothetical protein
MSTIAEKTSWRWQLGQLQQRVGEWLEVKFRTEDRDLKLDIFPAWLGPLLVNITLLLLAGAIAWVGYYIVYPYLRQLWQNINLPKSDLGQSSELGTIAQMLAKSQQFQQAGDYTQASRWLYLAMLERLNDANLIPHRSSRTDREYLSLLNNVPIANVGEILVSIHEQLHFGDCRIAPADFNRCQQAYQQIDREISR